MDTRLEEEDYDLIRENLGIDVPRVSVYHIFLQVLIIVLYTWNFYPAINLMIYKNRKI